MAYCEAADYNYLPVAKSIAVSLRDAHFHRMQSEANPLCLFTKHRQQIHVRKLKHTVRGLNPVRPQYCKSSIPIGQQINCKSGVIIIALVLIRYYFYTNNSLGHTTTVHLRLMREWLFKAVIL